MYPLLLYNDPSLVNKFDELETTVKSMNAITKVWLFFHEICFTTQNYHLFSPSTDYKTW